MSEDPKAGLKQKIEEEIALVKQNIERLKGAGGPVEPDRAIGRLTRMEAIQDQQMREASLNKAQQRLDQLKRTLQSLDNPEYGICRSCNQPIPLERLMLVPEAAICVPCSGR